MSSLLFYPQTSISNPYYHCHNPNVYKEWDYKKVRHMGKISSFFYLLLMTNFLFYLVISCSEGRDHEANVEVCGQDEVFQETLHVSIPRIPHHLPPVF